MRSFQISITWTKMEDSKTIGTFYRCLGDDHLGNACKWNRECRMDSCRESHHRLLYGQKTRNTNQRQATQSLLSNNQKTQTRTGRSSNPVSRQSPWKDFIAFVFEILLVCSVRFTRKVSKSKFQNTETFKLGLSILNSVQSKVTLTLGYKIIKHCGITCCSWLMLAKLVFGQVIHKDGLSKLWWFCCVSANIKSNCYVTPKQA